MLFARSEGQAVGLSEPRHLPTGEAEHALGCRSPDHAWWPLGEIPHLIELRNSGRRDKVKHTVAPDAEARAFRADPQGIVRRDEQAQQPVAGQPAMARGAEDLEVEPVEAYEAAKGRHPHVAVPVLHDVSDRTLGQALVDAPAAVDERPDLARSVRWALRRCGGQWHKARCGCEERSEAYTGAQGAQQPLERAHSTIVRVVRPEWAGQPEMVRDRKTVTDAYCPGGAARFFA